MREMEGSHAWVGGQRAVCVSLFLASAPCVCGRVRERRKTAAPGERESLFLLSLSPATCPHFPPSSFSLLPLSLSLPRERERKREDEIGRQGRGTENSEGGRARFSLQPAPPPPSIPSSFLISLSLRLSLPSFSVLALYGAQLAANFLWTPTFFQLKDLTLALADLALILGLATATALKFGAVTPLAGWLMCPYLAWTSYATALTTKLWIDNPSARESEPRARLTRAVRRVVLRKKGSGAAPAKQPSLERPGGKGAAASAAAIEAAAAAAAEKAVAAAAVAAEGAKMA